MSIQPTSEGDTATDFELLFDLVYVFGLTQVTGYIVHEHSAEGGLQGVIVLTLLWWTWCAYTWLGNQARADTGLLRAGMAVAMAAMFVVALAIPEAFHDLEGGLDGPVVFVCGYLVVRAVHLTVYSVAASEDAGLRRQVAISWIPLVLSGALLVTGALVGGWEQTALFGAALVLDTGAVYVSSRGGDWRVHSAAHWTERHGLFVILAIGESVVAIGVGAAEQAVGVPVLLAAALGIATAIALWWLYFDAVAAAAEERFHALRDRERADTAIDAYTYGHFPIVAGIIVAAVGVEGVLAHAGDGKGLGAFYALPLFGGAALYLVGHLLFKRRVLAHLGTPRLVALVAVLAALPAGVVLPPLAALALLVGVLVGLIAAER